MLSFFLKSLRTWNRANITELLGEEASAPVAGGEPMSLYWESDKLRAQERSVNYVDSFYKTEHRPLASESPQPVPESHYKYNYLYFTEAVKNLTSGGATETPNTSTGISSSGRDAGVVAGIVVAVISALIILAALIAVVMYRHYVHRNVTSMNFDNPVYRKTTEDQFALEKNGYAPGGKLYPSTVGEEAQEPLTTPATNDFV